MEKHYVLRTVEELHQLAQATLGCGEWASVLFNRVMHYYFCDELGVVEHDFDLAETPIGTFSERTEEVLKNHVAGAEKAARFREKQLAGKASYSVLKPRCQPHQSLRKSQWVRRAMIQAKQNGVGYLDDYPLTYRRGVWLYRGTGAVSPIACWHVLCEKIGIDVVEEVMKDFLKDEKSIEPIPERVFVRNRVFEGKQ